MRAWIIFIFTACASAASAWLTVQESPSSANRRVWVLAAVIVVACAATGNAGDRLIRSIRAAHTAPFERAAWQAIGVAYASLAGECGLDTKYLGVSAYMVLRTKKAPIRGELIRFALLRHDPQSPSPISWKKNRGVIGQCWYYADLARVHTASLWLPYGQCTKEEWGRLNRSNPGVTLRLTWRHWRSIEYKYVGVIAAPVTAGGRVRGVVAIDGKKEYVEWGRLDTPAVRTLASATAGKISEAMADNGTNAGGR